MSLRALFTFASFVSLSALAGCSVDLGSPSTTGTEGRARFAYASDCFFDCEVSRPMLVGTAEMVSVRPASPVGAGSLPKLGVSSNAPSVISVRALDRWSCCDDRGGACGLVAESDTCPAGSTKSHELTLEVTAHAAGDVSVALVREDGALFDRITLRAAVPARFDVRDAHHDRAVDAIDLTPSAAISLRIEAYDAAGTRLQADRGITLAVTDPTVARFVDPSWFFTDPEGLPVLEDQAWTSIVLKAHAPGATTLAVRSPGFERTLPLRVGK
jgi:hypothetical protein